MGDIEIELLFVLVYLLVGIVITVIYGALSGDRKDRLVTVFLYPVWILVSLIVCAPIFFDNILDYLTDKLYKLLKKYNT